MGFFDKIRGGKRQQKLREDLAKARSTPTVTAPVRDGPRDSSLASADAMSHFGKASAWTGVSSSNVDAIGYFSSIKLGQPSCMGVRFKSGKFYLYRVGISTYLAHLGSASKGHFVWADLRQAGVPYAGPF